MPPDASSPERKPALLALLVMTVAFITFTRTLGFDFVKWDDDIEIYANPHIRELDAKSLRWMFTDISYVRRYIPLGWLSWAINYRLGGLAPFGYHLGNVVFHVANAGLVFWLIRRVLRAKGILQGTHQDFIAAAGALVWAIHPLRVEPVAWCNGRIYTQCLFFLLFSVHCYLSSREPDRRPLSRNLLFGLSVGAYVLSLLSYGTSLGYPVVLLVMDAFVLGRLAPIRPGQSQKSRWIVILEKLPFALVAAAYLGVTLWARLNADAFWDPAPTLQDFGVFPRLAQASYMLFIYLWRTLLPLHLSPVYTELIWLTPLSFQFLACMGLAAFVTALAISWRKRHPALLAFWLCHVALLFPMLGLTERSHYPSDRYSYIQGIVLSVALALALDRTLAKAARPKAVGLTIATTLMAGCLGLLAARQAQVWTNSGTLFSYTLLKLGDDPYRVDIAWRLGYHLLKRRQYNEAIEYFDQTLERVPRHLDALYNKGKALHALGRVPEAVMLWTKALETEDDSRVRLSLGRGLLQLNQPGEARPHLESFLSRTPEDIEGQVLLIHSLRQLGDLPLARARAAALAARHPDHPSLQTLADQLSLQGTAGP